jgi:hypothetical protein
MKLLSGYYNFLLILITLTTFTIILLLFKNAGLEQQELLERALLNHNNVKSLFFHQELSINDNRLPAAMVAAAADDEDVTAEPKRRLTTFIENIDCSFFKSVDSNLKCLKKGDQFYLPIEYLQKKYDVHFFSLITKNGLFFLFVAAFQIVSNERREKREISHRVNQLENKLSRDCVQLVWSILVVQ